MLVREKNFLYYLIIAFGCYLLIALGVLFMHPIQDYNILMWQALSISSSIVFIAVGWQLTYRSIFLLIFCFHLLFSYLLFFDFKYIVGDILGHNPVDSLLYSNIAQKTCNLSLGQFFNVLENYFDSLSDYGFPFLLKHVYWIASGDSESGHILLIFCNCCFQTLTCYLTGKVAHNVCNNHDSIKLIVLLWGINPCSIFLNSSGLKEPFFGFLCMTIMWGIYRCHNSNSIIRHIILLLFIGASWFFRNYMTLFFLFIYVGFCIFPLLYKKIFLVVSVGSLILCIGFTSILVDYFPEIYYAMLQSEEVLPSGIGKYVYYILAF